MTKLFKKAYLIPKLFVKSPDIPAPSIPENARNVKVSSLVVSDLPSETKGSRFESGC